MKNRPTISGRAAFKAISITRSDRDETFSRSLLHAVEAGLDRLEGGVDRGADLADNRDDGNADESGDQAVLDCSGA